MDKFTANDITVDSDGLRFRGGGRLFPPDVDTLREFFRAESDERLGRWRYSDTITQTDFLVYPIKGIEGAQVRVVNERDGSQGRYTVMPAFLTLESGHRRAARAYFDAHPEPKPGDEALDGEYWELTFDGWYTGLFKRCGGEWRREGRKHKTAPHLPIIAATRIYPKEEA